MKPQHVLSALPLAGSGTAFVDAFLGTTPNHSFARRTAKSTSIAANLRMDMEGDSINERARLDIENTLFKQRMSLDRLVRSEQATNTVNIKKAEAVHGMPWRSSIGTDDDDTLLYMPFWEWQMDFMKESLTNLQVEPCSCRRGKVDFSYNENTKKKARLVNLCFSSNEYRKIRMTYYDAGDTTQVFNSVWYPDPSYNLPVLGIDLLAFNRKKYLAIVDFQPLHEDEDEHASTYEHILEPIKEEYQSLKGRMSSKFYDETQFFSQQMLFARFEDEEVVEKDLLPAFQRYVETHVDLLSNTVPDESALGARRVLERHASYDTYSAERDPATGLFAAMFGKEWADDFVYDFLFSMSNRSEGQSLTIPPTARKDGERQTKTQDSATTRVPH